MATRRFLFGYHPNFGTFGAWLTKSGFDVWTETNPDNYLLRPDYKFEQIVMSGTVAVGSGVSVNIPYPVTFDKKPYVSFHASQSTNVQYPHDLGLTGSTGQIELFVGMAVFYDQINFSNGNPGGMYYHYIVFHRGLAV